MTGPQPCTTEGRRLRHLSAALTWRSDSRPGLSGVTLCGYDGHGGEGGSDG
jgi:hypothetical protein